MDYIVSEHKTDFRHAKELANARQEAENVRAREEVCHGQMKVLKRRATDAEAMVDDLKDTIRYTLNRLDSI